MIHLCILKRCVLGRSKTRPKLVLSDALAVQSQGYQGPKVLSLRDVLGSQKCFGISKNSLESQKNG